MGDLNEVIDDREKIRGSSLEQMTLPLGDHS